MGLFDYLFHKSDPPQVPGSQPKSSTYSEQDMQSIGDMARRCAKIINESLQIVQNSQDAETKVSRLSVAKEKLQEAKQLARQYPFVRLTYLFEFECDIARLEHEMSAAKFQEAFQGNILGQTFEKSGDIDKAIAEYEQLVESGVDTPFTYRRLAILYRKSKHLDAELRVLRIALKNVPITNVTHYEWFQERLQKRK